MPDTHDAIDPIAREQVRGLRGEFHDFRAEVKKDVGELRDEMNHGLARIFNRLDQDQRWTMQQSSSGKGVLMGSIIGIVTIGFSFTAIVTQPLREATAENKAALTASHARDLAQERALGEASKQAQSTSAVVDLQQEEQDRIEQRLIDQQIKQATHEGWSKASIHDMRQHLDDMRQ